MGFVLVDTITYPPGRVHGHLRVSPDVTLNIVGEEGRLLAAGTEALRTSAPVIVYPKKRKAASASHVD